ncbi:MAG TPA: hypothetical protein VJU81_08695 [Methylomirabilota bacterium]|nr:hypothetical protein [Methylomirabilota bacterium]
MSRSLGRALPPDLLALLSQEDLPSLLGRVIPLITIGPDGQPHPMLCTYLEVLAVAPKVMRLAISMRSRTASNLQSRRVATFLLIDPERIVYVKCRAGAPPRVFSGLARFEISVEEVLEDTPEEGEGGVHLTSGITYTPPPRLESRWAKEVLAALRAE